MLNYCAKGTVAAQQLRRAMKIHNGLPLPCNQGGTGVLANTRNHKWIWREHFPFHCSVCKCTFHSSSWCFNKCWGDGGTLHSKPITGAGGKGQGRQDLGFRDLSELRESLPSSGFHPAPAGSEHRQSILSSTC